MSSTSPATPRLSPDDVRGYAAITELRSGARALADGVAAAKRGQFEQALVHYARAAAGIADDATSGVEAHWRQSEVYRTLGQLDSALAAATAAIDLAIAHRLPTQEAAARNAEAGAYMARGDFATAEGIFRALAEGAPTPRVAGHACQNLGCIAAMRQEFDTARRYFETSIGHYRHEHDLHAEIIVQNNLGRLLLDSGHATEAEAVFAETAALARRAGNVEFHTLAMVNLADAHLQAGHLDAAEQIAGEAMGQFGTSHASFYRVQVYRLLGDIAQARGHHDVAMRCYNRALTMAELMGLQQELEEIVPRMEAVAAARASGTPAVPSPASRSERVVR